jgi:dTDP-4-dehydrorhamnose reductase
MMRVLLVGSGGQLGRALRAANWPAGSALIAIDRSTLDVTEADSSARALAHWQPDVVINAAAYTAVDRAESEPEAAFATNRDGPDRLAAACAEHGAALVHVSTDYVFDGDSDRPWQPAAPVRPINVYGASKAAGEEAIRRTLKRHVIVRTAWLHAGHGQNFVATMLRAGRGHARLQVVTDQIGAPTPACDLAAALVQVAWRLHNNQGAYGSYHFCGEPAVSWHGFAEAIFDTAALFGYPRPEIAGISSDQWPTAAPRPRYSVLDCSTLRSDYGISPADWRTRLPTNVAALIAETPR